MAPVASIGRLRGQSPPQLMEDAMPSSRDPPRRVLDLDATAWIRTQRYDACSSRHAPDGVMALFRGWVGAFRLNSPTQTFVYSGKVVYRRTKGGEGTPLTTRCDRLTLGCSRWRASTYGHRFNFPPFWGDLRIALLPTYKRCTAIRPWVFQKGTCLPVTTYMGTEHHHGPP